MNKTLNLLCLLIIVTLGNVNSQTSQQLETAYKENSKEKLKAFLDAWTKDLPPATAHQREKLSKPVQQAYFVFEAFYNPYDISARGGSEFGKDIYKGFNYLIIQNRFKIFQKEKVYYTDEEEKAYAIEYITKNLDKKYHEQFIRSVNTGNGGLLSHYGPNKPIWEDSSKVLIDSVDNFYPNIIQPKATPLYITEKYNKLLNDFLGNTHSPFAEGGIMNIAKSKGESAGRQKFLENYIKIFYGHWGGYWQFLSYPSISALVFDKDFKYAKIFYRMIYEGGEAYLKYESNTWKLISMKRTWIE